MSQAIHLYRPHRTLPQALEAIFVGREALLDEILQHLAGWKPRASRQHYLLIGPRGIGKTSLLRIIEHRIRTNAALSRKWVPAALAEDSYRISKVSDILIEVLRILSDVHGLSQLADIYDQVRHDDDDRRIIDQCLDALRGFHRRTGSGILLMVENLNRFLGRPSSRSQAHLLRKILIEEDWLLAILTSPTHLNAVTKPEEPFFEFFQVKHLAEFTPEEQQQMLHKMAALEGNATFDRYLAEFQSRLRALYHFTGGNPRLGAMLYDLVANHSIRQVRDELDLLLDQLTPFYQGRMNDLGKQEARLLEAMALLPEGCTPTELAREARLPAKSVRSLMIRLEGAGYLRREQRRRKKTVYIIPERFFRIWHQMNYSRAARGRVQYLLEFFSSWYASRQERNRVWKEITTEIERGLETLGRIGSNEAVDPLMERLGDESMSVRRSSAVALARLAEGMPFTRSSETLHALGKCGLQEWPRIGFIVESLLGSAFRTGELEVVQSAVDTSVRYFEGDQESVWRPYMVAVKFLKSGRDPAVMERQHPEMREAAQILIGLFDSATGHPEKKTA